MIREKRQVKYNTNIVLVIYLTHYYNRYTSKFCDTHTHMSPQRAYKRVYCTAQLTLKRRPQVCETASVPVGMHITSGESQWGLLHYRGADPYLLTTTDT